ncbi:MAG: hypothetical protein AAF191_08455 [Verrucomicrobiota bacterium]
MAHAVKLGNPAQQFYFTLTPVFTEQDVRWFYNFISEDGLTFGAAFKLHPQSAERLNLITKEPAFQGKLLAAYVQPVTAQSPPVQSVVRIDRGVTDGVLVIWKGLTNEHLQILQRRIPHVREVSGN